MTNEEYIQELIRLSGIQLRPGVDECKAGLNITIASDYRGKPSSAIIAFEDCPPRLQVYAPIGYYRHIIVVGSKVFEPSLEGPYESLSRFIQRFIESRMLNNDLRVLPKAN